MARKTSLVYTLALFAVLCTTLFTPVQANTGNQIANHARMIRKRAVPTPAVPLLGVGNDPNAVDPNDQDTPPANTPPAGGAAPTESGTGAPGGVSQTSGNPSTPTKQPGLPPLLSISGLGAAPTPSASNSLASANSTLAQSSTSSLPSSSTTPPPSSSTSDAVVIATSTVVPTQNQAAASPSDTAGASGAASSGGGHLTRNTIIAIVVVAACVGGAIVIWTVIRKWKFAPSDEFEDRLNPIDWRPTGSEKEEKRGSGAGSSAGAGEVDGHRRRGSGGSNRSFVSADAHHHHQALADIPQHDFTAGPAHLAAPVGGYADLRRGPSPSPSMGDQYYGRGYGATTVGSQQQYGHAGY